MFGPNARTLPASSRYFHHRGVEYRILLQRTTDLFRAAFSLPESLYDVLFVTGSGTLVNEAVLWSMGDRVKVLGDGEFAGRLRRLAQAHGRLKKKAYPHYAMVAYETAESQVAGSNPAWPNGPSYGEGVRFADCVSSFPYYAPPTGADIWTTVSSKQLGALPVLGIVVVKRSAWRWLQKPERSYSYLNLSRWREAYETRQESPHTPAIPLLDDLRTRLEQFDTEKLRARINWRRQTLLYGVPSEWIVGEGPVVTIVHGAIPSTLVEKWGLYSSAEGWQFFLWSGDDADYAQFKKEWNAL